VVEREDAGLAVQLDRLAVGREPAGFDLADDAGGVGERGLERLDEAVGAALAPVVLSDFSHRMAGTPASTAASTWPSCWWGQVAMISRSTRSRSSSAR